jgi:hypothetical protein
MSPNKEWFAGFDLHEWFAGFDLHKAVVASIPRLLNI